MKRLATASLWTGIGLAWLFGLVLTLLLDYVAMLFALGGLFWLTGTTFVSIVVGLPLALFPTALYVWLTIFGNGIPAG